MFCTTEPKLAVPADASSRVAGDKIYVYAQAYPEVGEGADQYAQAEWLNEHGSGSAWSSGVSVTIA